MENPLSQVLTVNEAADIYGVKAGTIKQCCLGQRGLPRVLLRMNFVNPVNSG